MMFCLQSHECKKSVSKARVEVLQDLTSDFKCSFSCLDKQAMSRYLHQCAAWYTKFGKMISEFAILTNFGLCFGLRVACNLTQRFSLISSL